MSERPQAGVWCVILHAVLMQVLVYTLRITTSYRALSIDFPPEWLALFAAAFFLGPALISMPVGRMIDRHGEVFGLRLASAISLAAATTFYLFGDSVWVLVVLTALLGVAHSIILVAQQSYISKAMDTQNRDLWFGRYTVAISLGQFLSPGLIAILSLSAAMELNALLFLVSIGVAVATVAIILPLGREKQDAITRSTQQSASMRELLHIPGFSLAMVANVAVVISIDLFIVYLPALGESRGLAAAVVATLLAVRSLFSMLSRLCTEQLLRWCGRKATLVWGIGLAGACTMVLPFVSNLAVMGVLMAVAGFGMGLCLPLTLVWTSNITPDAARGAALSLRQNANRIAQLTLMPAMGLVATVAGTTSPFCIAGLGLLAMSGLIQTRVRQKI